MLRYKNIANVTIEIDLNNGYSVLAMARRNNGENTYSVTLYLKNNKYARKNTTINNIIVIIVNIIFFLFMFPPL